MALGLGLGLGLGLALPTRADAPDDITPAPPAVLGNVLVEHGDWVFYDAGGARFLRDTSLPRYRLEQFRRDPIGTEEGVQFDFGDPDLQGRLYYGLYPEDGTVAVPLPVYSKCSALIENGRADVRFAEHLTGKYDFAGWQETGRVHLGYRVQDEEGRLIYDGRIRLRGTGPFEVDTCIIEGPFVHRLTHEGAVIAFETNRPVTARIRTPAGTFADPAPTTHHEIRLRGLAADREHPYTVAYAGHRRTSSFRTAPAPGSRTAFRFAYASDGRGNRGGGERDLHGVNAYMLKRIAALCRQRGVRFFQFTGDLIDGYTVSEEHIRLQYANWKRTIEPFAHAFPFVAGFGNHESLLHAFVHREEEAARWLSFDAFPYATRSAEAVFAHVFVNPHNGPVSEDGTVYDPDARRDDFPPYDETVFYYTYDNVAMISLNSNYWFTPELRSVPGASGNLHGYVMDNQLQWLRDTLAHLEAQPAVDHVFVTIHTPLLPNGGHVSDDMWYDGDNEPRPVVAGVPVKIGILERRDQILDALMHGSSKVVAVLTGDEHNYNRLRLTEDVPLYPDGWDGPRLTSFRPLWLINNGAAGAPYYGPEETPWQDHVEVFSTQNAVVFFGVHGRRIEVEVINPDTLELLDAFLLRE